LEDPIPALKRECNEVVQAVAGAWMGCADCD